MNWRNVSGTNPGFSVYEAVAGVRTYRAQMKRGCGFWRLFIRESGEKTLRTILHADTLRECKVYAEHYEEHLEPGR